MARMRDYEKEEIEACEQLRKVLPQLVTLQHWARRVTEGAADALDSLPHTYAGTKMRDELIRSAEFAAEGLVKIVDGIKPPDEPPGPNAISDETRALLDQGDDEGPVR